MQALVLHVAAALGSFVRRAAQLPVGQLLLVAVALLVAPAAVGPAVAVLIVGLRLVYAAVWIYWRYLAPADTAAPAGG
jgi:hypothetical protein